jgi:Mycothiol maleylpyruvate isomerase N-terminal domain
MNKDVAAVMKELDGHRERYIAFCRSLSEEQLGRPVPNSTWVVRDFIAHLATIDGPVGEMFTAMREGGDPGVRTADGVKWDVDSWNDRQVEKRRARPLEEILEEAAASRAVLRETMARFSTEDLGRKLKFGGDGKRGPSEVPLLGYLRGWCKHDPMHAVDMARAMPEVLTPEFKAWIDDPVIAGYQAAMNQA